MANSKLVDVLFLSLFAGWAFGLEPLEKYGEVEKTYKAKLTLRYGDACSLSDQEKVNLFNVRTHQKLSTISTKRGLEALTQELSTLIISTSGSLCNEGLQLECRASTGTCGCKEYDPSVTRIPWNATTVRDGDRCRFTHGSTCFPLGAGEDDPCEVGRTCRIEWTQASCTVRNAGIEILGGVEPRQDTLIQIIRASYIQTVYGLCKCF